MHQKKFERTCTLCSAVAYCCGAVAPCAIAALLGRFLPRLGPLAIASGPFFLWGVATLYQRVIPGRCVMLSLRHSGAVRRTEPGISRFRIRAIARSGMMERATT